MQREVSDPLSRKALAFIFPLILTGTTFNHTSDLQLAAADWTLMSLEGFAESG